VVAFAAWLIGQAGWSLSWRAGLAAAAAVGAVVLTLPLLDGAPDDRGAIAAPVTGQQTTGNQRVGSGPAADTFSMARVNELRSAGRPVFVNLTAAWCISCKVNEQVALSGAGFDKALVDHDIAYLKGDWTRRDDHITKVLAAYGRAGVPLYLLFPADPSQPAIVLPQLLTEAIVLDHFAALKSGARPRR
jgi:thiol:disulfide interchange protein DsbD